jgi:hypothetical protein
MVFYFTLKDGTSAAVDDNDKHLIGDRQWYLRRGHLTGSVKGKRTKLVWLLDKTGYVVYKDGNAKNCHLPKEGARCSLCEHCQRHNLLSYDHRDDEGLMLLSPDEWSHIKSRFRESNEIVRGAIIDELWLQTREMEFPRYAYSFSKLLGDFYSLKHCEEKGIVNRNCGGALSRMFCADAILSCRKDGFSTADEVWADKKYFTRLIKGMIRLDAAAFNTNRINTTFACCFYKASNFPALIARNLYDYVFLPVRSNKRVLDPCAGYGGRLTGFWACDTCRSYVGIDPNPQLVGPYGEMEKWLRTHTGIDKRVQMIQHCAEDFEYDVLKPVDIIFTSPPYFNLEKYGTQATQSYIRYPSLEQWTQEFLLQLVDRCVVCLKDDGVLALNIRPHPSWKYPVLEKLIQKAQMLGFHLRETLYLPLQSRPNAKNKISQEPIFIFGRNEKSSPGSKSR